MKAFLAVSSAELLRQVPINMPRFDKTRPHRLVLEMFLPDLYNTGWPKTTKNRFKKKDASNLVKIVEDLVAKAVDIDDSCFITTTVTKFDGLAHQFTGVRLSLTELRDEDTMPCV